MHPDPGGSSPSPSASSSTEAHPAHGSMPSMPASPPPPGHLPFPPHQPQLYQSGQPGAAPPGASYPPYPPSPALPPYPGYPAYPPAPGYYPYPFYPAPMPPKQSSPKKSNKGLWITLSVVVGVLLVACIGCSALFAIAASHIATQTTQVSAALDPVIAAANFCAYETDQDYVNAYSQLSSNLQGQVSQQQFTSDNQMRDTKQGAVVGCAAASQQDTTAGTTPTSPDTLTLNIWLAPASGNGPPTNYNGTITMIQNSDSSWQIDAVDSTLPLT